jgi:U3 small nucleolar RNA-associated protein 20
MRSRMESVRETTREALRGMLTKLGPSYLGFTIKQLQYVLTKGFEVLVLGHVVHHLLQHMGPRLVAPLAHPQRARLLPN